MITSQEIGVSEDGTSIEKYILKNTNGFEVHLLSYGLYIQKIIYPDGTDIVLGYDTLEEYQNDNYYLGCIVGRNANRLSNASVIINDEEVKLSENEAPKQLHGGFEGFHRQCWQGHVEDDQLNFSYFSKDKEEGYPGNVTVVSTFQLTDTNELIIRYSAKSDQDTVVNLTRHDYFNLSGYNSKDIKDHEVSINAGYYTENDFANIPTGQIKSTSGSILDFKEAKVIGQQLNNYQGELPMGYDHNYIIDKPLDELGKAAKVVFDNKSLEILTTQPGVQLYTAAYVENLKGKSGNTYGPYAGLCLETQHFPDATKNNHFPSTILRKNEEYNHQLIYKFVN